MLNRILPLAALALATASPAFATSLTNGDFEKVHIDVRNDGTRTDYELDRLEGWQFTGKLTYLVDRGPYRAWVGSQVNNKFAVLKPGQSMWQETRVRGVGDFVVRFDTSTAGNAARGALGVRLQLIADGGQVTTLLSTNATPDPDGNTHTFRVADPGGSPAALRIEFVNSAGSAISIDNVSVGHG
ncbi:hypothetical protein [Luteibacter sp.]|uniref:hypothetical protein n=1 Tax=Luteibacter sp. TaxID=1886636 RepID=UPI003F7CFC6A